MIGVEVTSGACVTYVTVGLEPLGEGGSEATEGEEGNLIYN